MVIGRPDVLNTNDESGIYNSNLGLAKILKTLQTGQLEPENQKQLIDDGNTILYEAIHHYPHLAHSVEIQLTPQTFSDNARTIDSYHDSYRFPYKKLVEERIARGETDPYSLILPLPYDFKGRHLSRWAGPRREIYFTTASTNNREESIPVLGAMVAAPLIIRDVSIFLPKEIMRISLSKRTDFTPYYNIHSAESLEPREHYIAHYLGFRGFENRGTQKLLIRYPRPIVIGPSYNDKQLWKVDPRNNLERGFIVLYSEDPDQVIMHEVRNYPLKNQPTDEAIGKIINNITSPRKGIFRKPVDHDVFTGNQIIQRLAQIPMF